MTRRLNRLLLTLALGVGLPAWWLLVENHPHQPVPQPLAIAQLRRMADSPAGPRPSVIQLEVTAERRVAGTLVAAGIGFAPRRLALAAYRLKVAGGAPVVIADTLDGAAARAFGFTHFDAGAARRIAAAHAEPSVVLTAAGPPGDAPRAIAPGVVIVPAEGLRSGSRMVYVHLAGGGEVLFALGVAPLAINWRELRAPSRWLGQWRHRESRDAAFRWLATIRAWQQQAPALIVVPGADGEWFAEHADRPPFAGHFPG